MTTTTANIVLVGVGSIANDGTGDDLRTAFTKVNNNFSNIGTIGLSTGDINADGDVEIIGNLSVNAASTFSGNISSTGYFVGDGRFLSNVVGTYGNASVATYLPSYSGNISNVTVTGTISKKIRNESTANASVSSTIDFTVGGDELVYLNVTSNIAIAYSANIVAGRQIDVTVKNTSGGNLFIVLPNANNNKLDVNIAAPNNAWSRLLFTSYGTDSANVVVSVTN